MQKRTIKKQNLAGFTYSFLFSEKSRKKHKLFLSILLLFLLVPFIIADTNIPYINPSNYTYNNTDILVAGGVAKLQNLTNSSLTFYANYNTNIHGNMGSGDLSGTAYGGAIVSGGDLQLGFNDLRYVDYDADLNADSQQKGAVRFRVKPNYNGAPSGNMFFFTITEGLSIGNNALALIHLTTGDVRLLIRDENDSDIVVLDAPFNPTQNQEYEFEVDYDLTDGETRIFLDGNQIGVTNTSTGVRSSNIGIFHIGTNINQNSYSNFFINEIAVFNRVQHTANYNLGSDVIGLPYLTSKPTILFNNNISYDNVLYDFTETAITFGSDEITYVLSSDGGINYKWFNGVSWVNSDLSYAQSSLASDIDNNIISFDSGGGNLSVLAFLYSSGGTTTPELDNLFIQTNCTENWVDTSSCNLSDSKFVVYNDTNNCGSNFSLPADNGTIKTCDYCSSNFVCSVFNGTCGDTLPQPAILECLNYTLTDYGSCCAITNLTSDCVFSGNASYFNKLCGNISVVLVLPSYPYVDFNTSYEMKLYMYQNGNLVNLTDFKINLTEPSGNSSVFNFTWIPSENRFGKTLIFLENGDYPFKISAYYPYSNIEEITGILRVRNPFYVTLRLWELKDTTQSQYKNDFGYIFLEFKEPRYYNPTLENYLSPLFFKEGFDTSVFHAPYYHGEAIIKLWENDSVYEMRFVDGDVSFDSAYSPPIITKTFGTNFYLGEFNFTGTDEYDIYLKNKEIHQYRWLLNWGFIIGLVTILIVSVGLFFVIPELPMVSFSFGIGFSVLITLLRIVLWFWRGY